MGVSLSRDPSAGEQKGRALQQTGVVVGVHSCLSLHDFELLSVFLPANTPVVSPPLKDMLFLGDHFLPAPVLCSMFLGSLCSFHLLILIFSSSKC